MTAMNVNDSVRVRLTPHGLTILAEYHDRIRDQLPVSMRGLIKPTEAAADGLHTFLLWELLAILTASPTCSRTGRCTSSPGTPPGQWAPRCGTRRPARPPPASHTPLLR